MKRNEMQVIDGVVRNGQFDRVGDGFAAVGFLAAPRLYFGLRQRDLRALLQQVCQVAAAIRTCTSHGTSTTAGTTTRLLPITAMSERLQPGSTVGTRWPRGEMAWSG